jgi:hypothetical protein
VLVLLLGIVARSIQICVIKDVSTSYDALMDLFEFMESFLGHLDTIYTRAVVAQTLGVAYRLVKSMKETMDGARAWIYFLRMLTSVRSGGKAQDWRRSMTSAGTRYVQLVCVGSRD